MTSVKQKRKECYQALAETMDKRDKAYQLTKEYEEKYGFVPYPYSADVKFMAAYGEYKRTGGWRKNIIAREILKATAKKLAKNAKTK